MEIKLLISDAGLWLKTTLNLKSPSKRLFLLPNNWKDTPLSKLKLLTTKMLNKLLWSSKERSPKTSSGQLLLLTLRPVKSKSFQLNPLLSLFVQNLTDLHLKVKKKKKKLSLKFLKRKDKVKISKAIWVSNIKDSQQYQNRLVKREDLDLDLCPDLEFACLSTQLKQFLKFW